MAEKTKDRLKKVRRREREETKTEREGKIRLRKKWRKEMMRPRRQ